MRVLTGSRNGTRPGMVGQSINLTVTVRLFSGSSMGWQSFGCRCSSSAKFNIGPDY